MTKPSTNESSEQWDETVNMGWKTLIPVKIYDWFEGDPISRDLCIHILLKARREDMKFPSFHKNKPFQLKRGQLLFSRREWSKLLQREPSLIQRRLNRVINMRQQLPIKLHQQISKHYTIISVQNYSELVSFKDTNAPADEPPNSPQIHQSCSTVAPKQPRSYTRTAPQMHHPIDNKELKDSKTVKQE